MLKGQFQRLYYGRSENLKVQDCAVKVGYFAEFLLYIKNHDILYFKRNLVGLSIFTYIMYLVTGKLDPLSWIVTIPSAPLSDLKPLASFPCLITIYLR